METLSPFVLSPECCGHLVVGISALLCAVYSFYLARSQVSCGPPRLVRAMPVMATMVLLPVVYKHMIGYRYSCVTCVYAACLSWWSNSKVISMCCNRGPLARKGMSFSCFVSAMLLPINIADSFHKKEKVDDNTHDQRFSMQPKSSKIAQICPLWAHIIVKSAGFAASVFAATQYYPGVLSDFQFHVILTAIMYLDLCLHFDITGCISLSCFGVEVEESMIEPYLASSLADFWGRRWNLTASATLRHLVYEPVVSGHLCAPAGVAGKQRRPSRTRRCIAVLACFAVSGAVHEYIMWFSTGWYSGEWFAFFFINGLALSLETALKELWRKRDLPDIPKWISTPVTIFVLLYLAELLFYPPVVASGWSQFGVDDIKNQLAWMGLLPAV